MQTKSTTDNGLTADQRELIYSLMNFFAYRETKLAENTPTIRLNADTATTKELAEHWHNEGERNLGRIQALRTIQKDLGDILEAPEMLGIGGVK